MTGRTENLIEVTGLRKAYRSPSGQITQAIERLDFVQRPHEFVALVGPSGCGKTTLLRCLTGLSTPDEGTVLYDGEDVTGEVPSSVSVVFQEYNRSLFPWLTVLENVRFPFRNLPKQEGRDRAMQALKRVHLEDVPNAFPWQLSGGMQQRVAIARAIASEPRFLLMDEPFASVDAQTRLSLERMTLEIFHELELAVLLVTHDIDEAIFMADRVLVLSRRPSRIVREIEVRLDRPRDQVETRALEEFQNYRREIHGLIQGCSG
jgi:NitT/TauT family transport system ATP-binding protein